MKNLVFFLSLSPALALAEEAAEHAEAHAALPMQLLISQSFNVLLLVLVLVWFLRKPVGEFFSARKGTFETALNSARRAKEEAEAKQKLITNKIATLEAEYANQISQAEHKAREFKQQMIQDAKDQTVRMLQEAEEAKKTAVQSAVQELRKELLNQSLLATEQSLQSKMKTQDHEQLQNEIVKSMGVANT